MYISVMLLAMAGIITDDATTQSTFDVLPPTPHVSTMEVSAIICKNRERSRWHYVRILSSKSTQEMFSTIAVAKEDPGCFFEFLVVDNELLMMCARKADVAQCSALKVSKGESRKKVPYFMSIFPLGR